MGVADQSMTRPVTGQISGVWGLSLSGKYPERLSCLAWDNNAWRQPGLIGLTIRALNEIVACEGESSEARAEAAMLIKKLYASGKKPSVA